jgi:two-component system chemotaxis response regulator CheY
MKSAHWVLVVEDDETIRDTMVEFLEESGYSTKGVTNGREALEMLTGSAPRPCLIVLDLMMPIMDGRAFRDEQLQNPFLADIPVVVISAHRDVTDQATELDVTAHLKKPLKLTELLELVQRHCPH